MKTKIYSMLLSLFLLTGFLQAETITVLTPVAGDTWQKGTTQTITWTQSFTGIVNIDLYNNSHAWVADVADAYTGTSFNWLVPNVANGDYILEVTGGTATGTVTFTIGTVMAPFVTVLSPNGGEHWGKGYAQTITWDDNLTSTVKIDLYNSAGTSLVTGIADYVEGNSYTWNIPYWMIPGNYKVRISNHNNPSVTYDLSNDYFTITATAPSGTVTMVTPVENANLIRNNNCQITWTDNLNEDVRIKLQNQSTGTTEILTWATSGNSWDWWIQGTQAIGTYSLTVCSTLDETVKSVHKINIYATAPGGVVTITAPDDNVTWVRNNNYAVTWTKTFGEDVKIDLKNQSTGSTQNLAWSVGGLSWDWYIPYYQAPGTYTITVSSTLDGTVKHEHTLNIAATAPGGAVTITAPAPSETLVRNSSYHITWTKTFPEDVRIDLKNQSTGTTQTLTWATNGYSWDWWIPSYQAVGTYSITVSSIADGNVRDEHSITIAATAAGGAVTITTPVEDATLVRNSSCQINWTDNLTEDVRIKLQNQSTGVTETLTWATSGNSWAWWIQSTQAVGTYSLTVCSTMDESVKSVHKINIVATAPGGAVTITTPVDNATWLRNNTYQVSWTKTFAEDVKIDLTNQSNGSTQNLMWSAAGTSWDWYIPYYQTPGTYTITVSSTLDGSIKHEHKLNIAATAPGGVVTITAPAPGETLVRNTNYFITFTKTFAEDVRIDLKNQSTGTTQTLTWATNVTSWEWWIPSYQAVGTYSITVSSILDGNIKDEHSIIIAATAAGGAVTMTTPVENATLVRNGNCHITWTDNLTEDVRIKLQDQSTGTIQTLTWATNGNTWDWWIQSTQAVGTYSLTVCSTMDETVQSVHKINIVATAPGGAVTITTPVDNVTWIRNNSYQVSWTKTFTEDVKIDLKDQSTGSTQNLAWSVGGNTWDWYIPYYQAPGTYTITVSSTIDGAVKHENTLYIAATAPGGVVTITAPAEGETIVRNASYTIRWTKTFAEDVKIDLKNQSTGSTQTLTWATNGYSWDWWIPGTQATGTYSITVSSTLDGTVKDENSIIIAATAPGGVCTVVSPNGKEYWGVNTTHAITWTKNFTDDVKIELRKNSGSIQTLAASVSGTSWDWYIPFYQEAGKYKIRISNVNASSVTDESDNWFNIEIYDLLTYPNPVVSQVTLTSEMFAYSSCTIEVYNYFGTRVMARKVGILPSKEYTMSLDGLPNNVYYLVATFSDRRISKTIVIQH